MLTIIYCGLICTLFSACNANSTETTTEPIPYEFPKHHRKTINHNSTLRELLRKNDIEVDDLLKLSTSTENVLTETLFEKQNIDWMSNGKGIRENRMEKRVEKEEDGNDGLIQGQLGVILAAVFVAFAVLAYAILLVYRKYLESRYGSREILVDEDFNDPNDMRHFSV